MKYLKVGELLVVKEQISEDYRCVGCIFCDIMAECVLGEDAVQLMRCAAEERIDKKNVTFVVAGE